MKRLPNWRVELPLAAFFLIAMAAAGWIAGGIQARAAQW
jgi:hypothetical protein